MLDALPDDARLWVFAAARPLTPDAEARLLDAVRAFIGGWASHGRPVPGAAEVRDGRFLLVGAHLGEGANAGVSGCGIDSMTRAVEAAGEAVGVDWLGGLHVTYRDADGTVRAVSRPEFRAAVREGAVTDDTPVFDPTLATVGALREQGLERPAGESWHARAFGLGASSPAP